MSDIKDIVCCKQCVNVVIVPKNTPTVTYQYLCNTRWESGVEVSPYTYCTYFTNKDGIKNGNA